MTGVPDLRGDRRDHIVDAHAGPDPDREIPKLLAQRLKLDPDIAAVLMNADDLGKPALGRGAVKAKHFRIVAASRQNRQASKIAG